MTPSSIRRLLAALLFSAAFIASGLLFTAMADVTEAPSPPPLSDSKMFFISAEDLSADGADAAVMYAAENGYTHIIARYSDSARSGIYSELCGAAGQKGIGVLLLAEQTAPAGRLSELLSSEGFSSAAVELDGGLSGGASPLQAALSESSPDTPIGLYVKFTDSILNDDAASTLSDWRESGVCDFIIAQNLCSSYSEHSFADELAGLRAVCGDTLLIAAGDIGRILEPVTYGDFFGDIFELNYQYEISRSGADGFAVLDYNALKRNAYGSASSLSGEFKDSGFSYAEGSLEIPGRLTITRPCGNEADVSSEKYTIFGTSDPGQPLYLDGKEIERISKNGLFAVQVPVPVGTNTYSFTQGGVTAAASLHRSDPSQVSAISKIVSAYPYYQEGIHPGDRVTLTCTAPSGGSVSASVDGQRVQLTQAAATAYDGIPAVFTADFIFIGSGNYPENETVDIGPVSYSLYYGGRSSSFTTNGTFAVLAADSGYVVKCTNALGGVEKNAADEGNYITTLKPGCTDTVVGSEGSWWKLSCGGYIFKNNVTAVTGESPSAENSISGFTFGSDGRGNYLDIACSVLPAYTLDWSPRAMNVTLYSSSCSSYPKSFPGGLFRRVSSSCEGGTVRLSFVFSEAVWGYNMETDEDSNVLRIYIRRRPVLRESLSKPLDGIVVVIDAGHGGIDTGALSVAGRDGVNEADINRAHAQALKNLLERMGAEVVHNFASGDEKLSFSGRMDPAEDIKTDIYISLHSNSVAESTDSNIYCGTQVYYHYDSSRKFAELLADSISSATGRDNEGARQSYYRVTRMSFAPSVLVECGYVSNPAELESLIDPLSIEKTAAAIARSVTSVLAG